MNILFIDACIRENSRTRALCSTYITRRCSNADTLKTLQLTKTANLFSLDENALLKRDADCRENNFAADEYTLAKQFAAADEIVIAAPYWDCNFPSLLKVYFEHICVNGITFAYGENGTLIKKCRANRLVYVTTSGGYFAQQNSVKLYLQELCNLFGIENFKFFAAQGLDIQTNNVDDIMKQASEDICRAVNDG